MASGGELRGYLLQRSCVVVCLVIEGRGRRSDSSLSYMPYIVTNWNWWRAQQTHQHWRKSTTLEAKGLPPPMATLRWRQHPMRLCSTRLALSATCNDMSGVSPRWPVDAQLGLGERTRRGRRGRHHQQCISTYCGVVVARAAAAVRTSDMLNSTYICTWDLTSRSGSLHWLNMRAGASKSVNLCGMGT